MSEQRLKRLLALGILLGLVAATSGVFAPGSLLMQDAIVTINGESISHQDYLRTLEGLAQDKKNAISDQDRAWVLQRLVDEYLLIQRGAELGFSHSEPSVRQAVVNAVIQTALQQGATAEPDDAELQAFYTKHLDYFSPAPSVRVLSMMTASMKHAEQARASLQKGENPETVRARYAVDTPVKTPSSPLPLNRLRIYIGDTAVQMLAKMQVGEVTPPLVSGKRFLLVMLLDKQQEPAAAFAELKPQISTEFLRRRDEQILGDYLKWLSQRANIRYAEDAPRL